MTSQIEISNERVLTSLTRLQQTVDRGDVKQSITAALYAGAELRNDSSLRINIYRQNQNWVSCLEEMLYAPYAWLVSCELVIASPIVAFRNNIRHRL